MNKPKKRMADTLKQSRLIIEGARSEEALQTLLQFGYPEAGLDQGLVIHQAAEQAYLRVQKEQGEALGVSRELEARMKEVYTRYMGHVRVARKAFQKEPETRRTLSVIGRRRKDRTGWLRQASDFYQQALLDSNIQRVFAANGIDLAQAQTEVSDVLLLEVWLQRERAEALQARRDRDAAFEVLAGWLDVFVAVARLAFSGAPTLLKHLGL